MVSIALHVHSAWSTTLATYYLSNVAEERKSVLSMLGEFCREAAVLIFVFGNLDIWVRGFTGELGKLAIGFWAIIAHFFSVLSATAVFGAIGILLEK